MSTRLGVRARHRRLPEYVTQINSAKTDEEETIRVVNESREWKTYSEA